MCIRDRLSFDGIQYSYMAPDLFSEEYFVYAERHLRILSGLYGILEPFDGVVPYRLELDSPFYTPFCTSLYDFWGSKPYQRLIEEDKQILDLSSKQYGRLIKRHLDPDVHLVSVYSVSYTHLDVYKRQDITMVYDQPIHLTAEILSELQDKVRNETELKTIQDIKTKYCTYQGYILSQLDEEICEKLVDDLKRLSE